ncbi:hypothetical protein ACFQL1_18950 [Halomicroarcula sp. GCM10025709]|uniref:DUF7576 family protein n=1 Tax=Haloarcula TaxID=2237 RepID=UPI0024C2B44F|nr:hypothetical protein [Halomicroarcula sp. YJ-61-S]
MVDPTSDHHEDIDEDEAPNCAVCGDAIANEVTHRVTTWVEDGNVQTAHFCDEQCRAEWDEN